MGKNTQASLVEYRKKRTLLQKKRKQKGRKNSNSCIADSKNMKEGECGSDMEMED